jgi:hypothetical protein
VATFEADIKPMFREEDREAMLGHFDLWSYDDVVANQDSILGAVSAGVMPCDGAWPHENVERLRGWIAEGSPRDGL